MTKNAKLATLADMAKMKGMAIMGTVSISPE